MRKLIVGAAAAALVASGTVAQAAPVARTAAPVGEAESMGGGSPALLGVLGAIVLGLIIWQINDDDDDEDSPTSP